MTPSVVVVGSLNMDLVVTTPRLPAPGETLLGGGFANHAGGKGANQAVAAARLGARVTMVGACGQDAFGNALVAGLAADGVDVTGVLRRDDVPTGIALITVDAAGANTIVVAAGANATLTPSDVDRSRQAIVDADVLVVQLETPLAAITHAVQLAAASDRHVILNAAPAATLPRELLAGVRTLVVNETEAAIVAGTSGEISTLLAALRALGPKTVVVTLGDRGALTLHESELIRTPAFPVNAVDTVGAGDAFVGSFATACAMASPVRHALRFAAAAGALAVTRAGAQSSLPHRADVEGLLASAATQA